MHRSAIRERTKQRNAAKEQLLRWEAIIAGHPRGSAVREHAEKKAENLREEVQRLNATLGRHA